MSKFTKKKSSELPPISTASLPDIVFMLLFFFMVATVMRTGNVNVKNELPSADQVEKLEKKDLVMYMYVGKPKDEFASKFGKEARLQLNDKFSDIKDIKAFVAAERAARREELIPKLITCIKVDNDANMGLVGDVKQVLRDENALKINYATRKGEVGNNI